MPLFRVRHLVSKSASVALSAEREDEVKFSEVASLILIAVAFKSTNAAPRICCHSVTSPILPFKQIVLYLFLDTQGTNIHQVKVFMARLFTHLLPGRSVLGHSVDSLTYVYIIYCKKHILIIFVCMCVWQHLFKKKKRQSSTSLVVTILSPFVFLTMLWVCQEKLWNKFNVVIITNKSPWHLCRKTPPSLCASTTVVNLFQKFWWNAL